jgi:hypothetical protein
MSQTFDLRPSIDAPPLLPASQQLVRQRSGLPRGYVLAWVSLAVGSLSYLSVLAVRSGDLQASAPATIAAVQRDTPLQVAQAESRKLKARLGEFQRDIAQLRGQLEVNGQDRSTIAALAAFEERFSTETGIAVARSLPSSNSTAAAMGATMGGAPASIPVANASPVPEAPSAPVAAVAPGLAPTASAAPRFIARVDGPKIETGSIPVPAKPAAAPNAAQPGTPIAFGPAVVKVEPKPLGVQLGSGLTLDALRLNWSVLSESHGDTLKSLSPRYTSSGTPEAGQVFDLVAGPVKSAADGKRICKALAARGVDCSVGPMAGSAL